MEAAKRWKLWLAVAFFALVTMAALTPARHTERESLEALMPELHLAVRKVEFNGDVDWLYTGSADPEALVRRFETALQSRSGWLVPRLRGGSPFPYRNDYRPPFPIWGRIPFLTSLAVRSWRDQHPLDLRVLRGRAGARPEGGPWTTVLIREQTYAVVSGPDVSEPVPGWGVQLW